jgi:hypothetical protein
MVKLIRLTTTNSNGIFNNTLNTDVIVEENSKIALCNFSAEIRQDIININATNDKINCQLIGTEGPRTTNLSLNIYSRNNYEDLFNDMTYKLNKIVSYLSSNIGRQWLTCINDSTNKCEIAIKKGMISKPEIIQTSPSLKLKDVEKVNGVNTYRRLETANILGNNAFMYYNNPISKGSGTWRARIARATNQSGTDPKGVIIGLIKQENKPVDTTLEIPLSSISYGISFTTTTAGKYSKIIDGIETLTDINVNVYGDSGEIQTKNDYIDIEISNGKIYGKVYKWNETTQNQTIDTLFDIDYTQEHLYPVLIFRGNETSRMKDIVFSNDPYYNDQVEEYVEKEEAGIVYVKPPTPFNRRPTSGFFQFESNSLASYLGFNNSRIPSSGEVEIGNNYVFKADIEFTLSDLSDTYVIELLGNIQLDSYDTVDKQRRNILHTIIQPNIVSQRLVYMAPYPLWIDIKNKQKLTMRNFSCRVLKEDLTPVVFSGFSQITILIESNDNI